MERKNIQILYFDTSKAIKRRVRWSEELVCCCCSVFISNILITLWRHFYELWWIWGKRFLDVGFYKKKLLRACEDENLLMQGQDTFMCFFL
jgi:hypothetical protein